MFWVWKKKKKQIKGKRNVEMRKWQKRKREREGGDMIEKAELFEKIYVNLLGTLQSTRQILDYIQP